MAWYLVKYMIRLHGVMLSEAQGQLYQLRISSYPMCYFEGSSLYLAFSSLTINN